MPDYKTPGVYVEEAPSVSQPITGVGTTTAGFIGVVQDTVKLPEDSSNQTLPKEGVAELINNWGQFKRSFGDIQDG